MFIKISVVPADITKASILTKCVRELKAQGYIVVTSSRGFDNFIIETNRASDVTWLALCYPEFVVEEIPGVD